MYYKSKDFKNLQRDWYQVLKIFGFKDIERKPEEECEVIMPQLINMSAPAVKKDTYYLLYVDYAKTGSFPRNLDRWIWNAFIEGCSEREIVQLNDRLELYPTFKRDTVRRSIASTKRRMGMRVKFHEQV